jgi:lia operon protein LiaG
MKSYLFRSITISSVICLLLTLTASAQDFQKNYRIGAGGAVNIRNVSGDVTVTGYSGDTITVTAYKEGPDRDQVTIEDSSGGNNVDVRARYPENCNCNVSVRFDVKVPSGISYRYDSITSVSGDVNIANVKGDLHVKSVSGDVSVKGTAGAVNAASVSGDVEVEIQSLEGADGASNMEFNSVSGDVDVKLPGNLDANVRMSTLSGELKTDFPLQIEEKERGPGRSANGRLGNGSRSLKLSTVSGDINLSRR